MTRKQGAEEILKKERIKINFNLPHIESEEETTIRTSKKNSIVHP